MDRPLLWILLLTYALSGVLGRHVFVDQPRGWADAQKTCRAEHTDLSPVTSVRDTDGLREASGGTLKRSWVGLHRNNSVWRWSGGGVLTDYQPWQDWEPNNWLGNEWVVEIRPTGEWNDRQEYKNSSFFCISLTLVSENLRWEEALEHCRRQEGDLLAMPSDTRHLLALSELQKTQTQRVWVGLRYLRNRWLWVNGDPMGFQGWSKAGGRSPRDNGEETLPREPRCPALDGSCGALTREGLWEARDCREKLSFICD